MNILFLSIGVKDGSAFSRGFHLAKGLVKIGHQVTLVVSSNNYLGEIETREGVNIITFFDFLPSYIRRGGASPVDLIQRLFYISRFDFDLVYVDCGFRPVTGIPGYLYSRLKGVPYVCEWWDWIGRGGIFEKKSIKYKLTLGLIDDYFERFDKRYSDGVVALSSCLQERAIALGQSNESVCVIHGGADIDISNVPDKTTARRQLGISDNALVIGFSGMDDQEVDDLRPFLESVQLIRQRYPDFIWFSTGGYMRNDLRRLYSVGAEYREFGWVDYKTYQCCLAAADILLLIQEDTVINRARWPNKLGDYLASNSVVLATNVGELAKFARLYSPNGIVFTKWEADALMASIINIYSNPDVMNNMANLNMNIATTSFSWDKKAVELNAFLNRIVT